MTSAAVEKDDSLAQREKLMAEQTKEILWLVRHGDEYRARLFQNIKARLPQLEKLLADLEDQQVVEDGVYRFYHGSFKVYGLQHATTLMTDTFKGLLSDRPLNASFAKIVAEGTGHAFENEDPANSLTTTRRIVEACVHAHYFLRMICKYGRELDELPDCMPSGWAAVLYLYNLR